MHNFISTGHCDFNALDPGPKQKAREYMLTDHISDRDTLAILEELDKAGKNARRSITEEIVFRHIDRIAKRDGICFARDGSIVINGY